jgi:hypothetical protein
MEERRRKASEREYYESEACEGNEKKEKREKKRISGMRKHRKQLVVMFWVVKVS